MKVGLIFNPLDCGSGQSALMLPWKWLPQADSGYSDGKRLLRWTTFKNKYLVSVQGIIRSS